MKPVIVGVFVMLCLVLVLPRVNAQAYFTVYPTEGTVNTNIFLQIRGLPGSGFYETYYLYIFWDNYTLLGIFPDNSQTYNHYFDTYFSPPNNGTLSALGNHTVYFEVWDPGRTGMFINATFTFTITEYLPNSEYLALNATYYQFLTECNALNATYQNLTAQYNTLSANFETLLSQYGDLSRNYDSLLPSYHSLSSDYEAMNSTYYQLEANYQSLNSAYGELQGNYDELAGSYNSLQSIHNNLTLNYAQLQGNYTLLVSSFSDLQTKHNGISTDLTNYRDATYALIIAVLVLLATSIYFATRKPKTKI